MTKSESPLTSYLATNLGTLGGPGQLQPFTFSTADVERYVFYGPMEPLVPYALPFEATAPPDEAEYVPFSRRLAALHRPPA